MPSQESALHSAQILVDVMRAQKETADQNGGDPDTDRAYNTALKLHQQVANTPES